MSLHLSENAAIELAVHDGEALFHSALPIIDKSLVFVARRYRLRDQDQEEFAAEVKLRLVLDDYCLLRRFEGRSSLETYLFTVITSLFWDWSNKTWGRWRPSAEAARLGETAIKLEALVYRDGYRFDEAARILRINHGVTARESELESLLARLPNRPQRTFVDKDQLREMAQVAPSLDEQIQDRQRMPLGHRLKQALTEAMQGLPDEDQLILKLHFQKGLKLVDVARSLGYPQKRFYKHLKQILKRLYKNLAGKGFHELDREELYTALNLSVTSVMGNSEWGQPNGE